MKDISHAELTADVNTAIAVLNCRGLVKPEGQENAQLLLNSSMGELLKRYGKQPASKPAGV